jgi:hypothetical protein
MIASVNSGGVMGKFCFGLFSGMFALGISLSHGNIAGCVFAIITTIILQIYEYFTNK